MDNEKIKHLTLANSEEHSKYESLSSNFDSL
jgi:hypothetical protein